ncbi:MAG: hypothetical protein PHD61_05605 [Bacteroidales bacterium]|nr:hypothetical protein [Lentimicrobiaceae bacterium]MDD5694762.1 hypothetical protein [Bacteroidales bacterium]
MKETFINDDRLRALVKKSGRSPAPEDFTRNVMERIQHEPVPEASLAHSLFSRKNVWKIILAVIAVIAFVVFLLQWSPVDLNPDNIDFQQYEKLVPFFQSFVQSLSKSFAFLTRSSLPLIIGIGVAVLFLFDRILRKLTMKKSYLF